MLLGICLIGIGVNNFNTEQKNIKINKVVTGKYQVNSKMENNDIKENTQTLSNTSNEASSELKQSEIKSTKFKENQNSVGKPIKAELTAYCDDPRCSDQWGSQTAMQTETRLGVVAAPSNIPLGSKIYIPELENYKEDGMFDVEDRGGAIKIKKDGTYIIDVWVPTYEEAVAFGRKNTTIYLVE